MQRPKTDHDSLSRPADAGPESRERPWDPKTPADSDDSRPQSQSPKPKVTPLDEDKTVEQGIDVKET
jgi:hypothetical protein